MNKVFIEGFDQPKRGWIGWTHAGAIPTEVRDGAAVSRGPWWVDGNHAPPGAGYLHILFALWTRYTGNLAAQLDPIGGTNPFVEGNYPTDFRNARITCRLKGNLTPRGASVMLLAQGKLKSTGKWVNQALSAQPFKVTPEWTTQTIQLVPDQKQWTQLGTRHDRTDRYGEGPIEELLADLNYDIIFVLFPLDVRPAKPIEGDMHRLIPDSGFEVDRTRLPEGEVWMDDFKIEFAG